MIEFREGDKIRAREGHSNQCIMDGGGEGTVHRTGSSFVKVITGKGQALYCSNPRDHLEVVNRPTRELDGWVWCEKAQNPHLITSWCSGSHVKLYADIHQHHFVPATEKCEGCQEVRVCG
jgi:hypothetical protein